MSATNIVPPAPFSTSGPYTQITQSWNPISKKWNTPTVINGSNTEHTGATGRVSVVTPNYIHASNTGNLPFNAFSYTKNASRRFSGMESTHRTNISKTDRFGVFPEVYCPVPSLNSISSARRFNLDNEVKQKVFERVRDSDVNLAIIWGERQRTIQLLKDTILKLARSYNLAKRGDFKGALASLGYGRRPAPNPRAGVANNWLEIQYGWLPLLNDIYGSCATLQKQMTFKEYVVLKAKKEIKDVIKYSVTQGVYQDFIVADATYQCTVRVKMRSTSRSLKTAAELGLTNPALLAWELLPFSFVVDWAIPIGSFISQFDSALGWQFSGGAFTRYYKQFSKKQRTVPAIPPGYDSFVAEGSCDNSALNVDRTGIGSWSELYSIPYIKDPASITHILNALALLTSKR